jgi:signal peptidase I
MSTPAVEKAPPPDPAPGHAFGHGGGHDGHLHLPSVPKALATMLTLVVVTMFLHTFVLQPFFIPSESMERTLLVGDFLLFNKQVYAPPGPLSKWLMPYRPVERGDIVVFHHTQPPLLVKRVIGLPGDHLKIVDQRVFINGKALNEPYVTHDPNVGYDPLNYNFPPKGVQLYSSPMVPEWATTFKKYVQDEEIVVPPGKYFAMGDNRDHSADSRYWGFVDRDAIMGRPFLIYWSVDASSADYTPNTFFQRLTGIFETIAHLPTRTRWSRMLRTVH